MGRKQFTFYRSYYDALCQLSAPKRARMLEAIVAYGLDGIEPTGLSKVENAVFTLVRPNLDSSRKRAAAGMVGGLAKTNGLSKKEIEIEKEIENEIETETEGEEEGDCAFAAFWAAYPRKTEKRRALKLWNFLRPDPQEVMDGLEQWLRSEDWKVQDGRFIPGAAKWLRGEYWKAAPKAPVCGANGGLGEAELEAIRRVLEEG